MLIVFEFDCISVSTVILAGVNDNASNANGDKGLGYGSQGCIFEINGLIEGISDTNVDSFDGCSSDDTTVDKEVNVFTDEEVGIALDDEVDEDNTKPNPNLYNSSFLGPYINPYCNARLCTVGFGE